MKIIVSWSPLESNGHLYLSEYNEKKTLATKEYKIYKQTQHGTIKTDKKHVDEDLQMMDEELQLIMFGETSPIGESPSPLRRFR